jgi:hypothetical protein
MELLLKVAIVVVIIVLIIGIFFLIESFYKVSGGGLTLAQAEALVLNDLRQHAPNAEISVLNVSNSSLHSGSWSILVREIYNPSSACPSVITEMFDYPATGLLNTTIVYSNYSDGFCRVYVGFNSKSGLINNIVGLPAIAIAMPYNSSFAPLISYINEFGYSNVRAAANFLRSLNLSDMNASLANFENVWQINYTASNANYSYYIILNKSGYVVFNYTEAK